MSTRALLLYAAAGCLSEAGCGRVEFVAAPFTPTAVEVAYSAEEDLTRLRWQVADPTKLQFELRSADRDWAPVDFAGAPYPSGDYGCGAGGCFQLVLRGALRRPSDGVVVRSRHEDFGLFTGFSATVAAPISHPVTLSSELSEDAANLAVTVTDWLSVPGLVRSFALTLWEEPSAPCAVEADRPDDALEVSAAAQSLPFAEPLTDAGRYCARVRPHPGDGGARLAVVAPLLTQPSTFREERDYQPDVEEAPVVWRLIDDLQIVDPDRCTQVAQAVHDALAAAVAQTGSLRHELPLVDLAPGCHQLAGRSIDAGPLADEVKTYLAASYPNLWHRPILIYADNLDAPLPDSLTTSLETYVASFQDPHVQPFQLGLVSGAALGSFPWDAPLQFVAIEDPQFATTITDLAKSNLPFRSQLHDPDDILPLMPTQTVQSAAGEPWKVCQASPAIQRLAGTVPIADGDLTPAIDPAAPPSFTVTLPVKVLVPSSQFMRDTVVVRYEICRRWCDHPFRDEGGAAHTSWSTAAACVRNEVP